MIPIIVSVLAIVVSGVTFGLSYRASQAAERRSRIPVLVFVYDSSKGWLLRNVGNGPALNIEVAQNIAPGEGAGSWIHPVRVPPLGRDREIVLAWLGSTNLDGLGAVYEDFLSADEGKNGRVYTVICGDDRNNIMPGRHLPRWTKIDIQWKADQGFGDR